MRQFTFNIFTSADKVLRVVVVLVDTGRYGEDVWIENNVFRRETDLFGQNIVGTAANFDLRSRVSACPCSSKAMTTTAAP
ncbi:Uncharacterised protein [Salmonella enterica subsp. arizonae]|uniref:Uncharacterized protein n=1 Tax=Salmonella enterica subsp. arizonae TaxID=59203 RepID=A0A3S4K5G2_SALER|nr:Uncharacterised protein [Salmonella enterica subsp. arizonae]